jgi:t-SNARE complex subunit (syntaxin)
MAKKTTLKEVAHMLAHVVKHMATKDDIADLKQELKGDISRVQEQVTSIEGQLRHGRYEVRLGKLEEKVFGSPRR